jgi:hypothetical protein
MTARVVLWGSRLLAIAVALWWPPVWRDPIYTPRQARVDGQELRLPGGAAPKTEDERAFAIFSAWESRSLVTTNWMVGPYRGFRHPSGWKQTLLVIGALWIFGSALFSLFPKIAPPNPRKKRGLFGILTTPLWQLFPSPRATGPPGGESAEVS